MDWNTQDLLALVLADIRHMLLTTLVIALVVNWWRHRQERSALRNAIDAATTEARASIEAMRSSHRDEIEKINVEFDDYVRENERRFATAKLGHEQAITTLQEFAGRTSEELRSTKESLRMAKLENERLREDVEYATGLVQRIRHDIPKRLDFIAARFVKALPSTEVRNQLLEDLRTVVAKLQLHLSGEIAAHVREVMSEEEEEPSGSLETLVRYLLELHDCEPKRLDVEFHAPVSMIGERAHWDLMITNVLSNAIYHAKKAKGRVYIRLTCEENRAEICITNDGSHVPDADLGKIFDRGYTTKEGGLGLGLYIAREIAQGLGGDIRVENLPSTLMRKSRVTFCLVRLPVFVGPTTAEKVP